MSHQGKRIIVDGDRSCCYYCWSNWCGYFCTCSWLQFHEKYDNWTEEDLRRLAASLPVVGEGGGVLGPTDNRSSRAASLLLNEQLIQDMKDMQQNNDHFSSDSEVGNSLNSYNFEGDSTNLSAASRSQRARSVLFDSQHTYRASIDFSKTIGARGQMSADALAGWHEATQVSGQEICNLENNPAAMLKALDDDISEDIRSPIISLSENANSIVKVRTNDEQKNKHDKIYTADSSSTVDTAVEPSNRDSLPKLDPKDIEFLDKEISATLNSKQREEIEKEAKEKSKMIGVPEGLDAATIDIVPVKKMAFSRPAAPRKNAKRGALVAKLPPPPPAPPEVQVSSLTEKDSVTSVAEVQFFDGTHVPNDKFSPECPDATYARIIRENEEVPSLPPRSYNKLVVKDL